MCGPSQLQASLSGRSVVVFFRLPYHHRGSGCSFIDWMMLAQVSGAEKEVEELSSSVESIFILNLRLVRYVRQECFVFSIKMFRLKAFASV